MKRVTRQLTLRHDVAKTPLPPALPPISSGSALPREAELGPLAALGPR